MQSRNISDKKSIIIEAFCRNIKELINLANNLMPNNEDLMLLKRGARIAASTISNVLIEQIGLEIYQYRKSIVKNDFTFIHDVDFNKQIDDRKDMFVNNDNSKINEYKKLIPLVLQTYHDTSEEEMEKINGIIKQLLAEYIKYRLHEKKHGSG